MRRKTKKKTTLPIPTRCCGGATITIPIRTITITQGVVALVTIILVITTFGAVVHRLKKKQREIPSPNIAGASAVMTPTRSRSFLLPTQRKSLFESGRVALVIIRVS